MGFRRQITEPNAVGVWLRSYREENDLSVTELQDALDLNASVELGTPVHRIETTDSPMTRKTTDVLLEYFNIEDGDETHDLVKAIREHNHKQLGEVYLI